MQVIKMNKLDRDDINRVIEIITNSSATDKESYFATEFAEFKKQYPMLYKMVCSERIDIHNLQFMMGMLTMMEKENMSQYDASAHVGQMLYSKYVEPKINQKKE